MRRKQMEFYYNSSIKALKNFYLSMRKINVQIGTFEYTYNEIVSDVIFDTRDSDLWKLVFIKRGNGDMLSIPIKKGYRFTIKGNEKYKEFADYFDIGRGKGQFSIKDFVNHLNNKIPFEYGLSDNVRITILKYDGIDTDSDGIFPIGIKNWEVIHAKNPMISKDKYHRTNKNLSKTRQLYPSIYLATKDMDITIIYGTIPGEKTEKLKKCKFD